MRHADIRGPSGWRTAWVFVGIFVWLAAVAWFRPFMAPDEGRYVGVAYEMLHSGDWLVPRLDSLPFFHKPPLFYWLSAAFMSVFGISEWAARLPSVLGASVAAGALFLFLRRWVDVRHATASTVVLATMPFFYAGAQFANLDMLVAGCISATVLLAIHATLAREQQEPWRAALAGAFAFAALGILSKGLIGLLLPGGVFLLWCAATRRLRAVGWSIAWLPGWCIFVAIAAPWMVAMQLRYPDFFDYFIITQHFRRFSGSGFNNEQPLWFYLPIVAGLALPWSAWFVVAWYKARPLRKPVLSEVDWLMLIWFACIIGFFSLPRSKLIGYALPALPPLAYLIARAALAVTKAQGPWPRSLRATAALAAAICVATVVAVGLGVSQPSTRLRLPANLQVAPADQLLMLDAYYYELPIHWKLRRPVMISGNWTADAINQRDDWRKEVFDGGRFEPQRSSKLLVDGSRLSDVLCVPATTWVIGPSNSQLQNPWLAHVELVALAQTAAVWRFPGSATRDPQCLQAAGSEAPPASARP
ncbi:ArnT family glycosyltransferase [Variovorax sp. M-6]|uniref:ArnT family glycosyltransferase n=1 Tax=Variovorax sp. M-6 TaxID=3233041 RepID=UPI003F96D19C